MRPEELRARLEALKQSTHDALTTVIQELNHGQRQKIVKNPEVKALLDRYNVDYSNSK